MDFQAKIKKIEALIAGGKARESGMLQNSPKIAFGALQPRSGLPSRSSILSLWEIFGRKNFLLPFAININFERTDI